MLIAGGILFIVLVAVAFFSGRSRGKAELQAVTQSKIEAERRAAIYESAAEDIKAERDKYKADLDTLLARLDKKAKQRKQIPVITDEAEQVKALKDMGYESAHIEGKK